MIVLGIDPGTAALGYGIIEQEGATMRALDHGCLVTSPDSSLPERLLSVHRLVADLIALHRPDLVGVERLFFSRNAQTAFGVGQARGVVLLACAEARAVVREATPNQVKVAVAGHGAADKEQVQRMVQVVLGMTELPTPDDAADALAVAICVATSERAGEQLGAAVLDRSAIAPMERRPSGYEQAVQAALAAERSTAARRG